MPVIWADNTDYVEYKLGWRAEAAISSLNSFIIKASHGVGGAIGGYILSATGYIANQPQTDLAKFGINFNVIAVPIIAYIIGILVFGIGYKLDNEKLTEVNETLRQRREEKAAVQLSHEG
jgi:GPH family glycoside/pentoside/hexuronide:cation symporter/glucuronide carrier protein